MKQVCLIVKLNMPGVSFIVQHGNPLLLSIRV
jgi:hypothetical protein